jgi:hypothetical protein
VRGVLQEGEKVRTVIGGGVDPDLTINITMAINRRLRVVNTSKIITKKSMNKRKGYKKIETNFKITKIKTQKLKTKKRIFLRKRLIFKIKK